MAQPTPTTWMEQCQARREQRRLAIQAQQREAAREYLRRRATDRPLRRRDRSD